MAAYVADSGELDHDTWMDESACSSNRGLTRGTELAVRVSSSADSVAVSGQSSFDTWHYRCARHSRVCFCRWNKIGDGF